MALKLQQGQLWKNEENLIRIVHLERLAVGYKVMTDPASPEGVHLTATKKEFCRMLKGRTMIGLGAKQAVAPKASLEGQS